MPRSYAKIMDGSEPWSDDAIAVLVADVLAQMPKNPELPFNEPKPNAVCSKAQRAWYSMRKRMWEKTGGYCSYCHRPLPTNWEVDHVVPRFQGGPDRVVNKLPCCYRCNVEKGGGLPRVQL